MPAEQADARLEHWRTRIEGVLDAALPADDTSPHRLHAAMRHAVLGGGKRLRPLLVYAAGRACGVDADQLDAPAAAVELIHAYSLVHDDLPAMDDDALRRGRPTVHIAFDEATAILAGDALQTLAFGVLAEADADALTRVEWLRSLADASGAAGMCGGQALDIDATGSMRSASPLHSPTDASGAIDSIAALERMHALKTGALIRAAVRMGAIAGGIGHRRVARLDDYARALGLAFQIQDDILDVEGDSHSLGKTAGKDAAQNKLTYPSLLGLAGAKSRLQDLAATLHEALSDFDADADALRALAALTVQRRH